MSGNAEAGKRNWVKQSAIAAGSIILLLLTLAAGIYFGLDTDTGKRMVARQIEKFEFENGVKIGVGKISGSLYGKMRITDLTLSDGKGVFLRVPGANIDWRPLSYWNNHVDIKEFYAQSANLSRLPVLKPTNPDDPWLPDMDVDIRRFAVDQVEIGEAVAGSAFTGTMTGNVAIADRRAKIVANGNTVTSSSKSSGDKFALLLDAVPDAGNFDLDFKLDAPADGLIAGLSGVAAKQDISLTGKGDWANWNGVLSGTISGEQIADLALTGKSGVFTVKGQLNAARFLPASLQAVLMPSAQINVKAGLAQRIVTLDANLTSERLSLVSSGIVDLGENMFSGLSVDMHSVGPAVLAENFWAQGLAAKLLLDGKFSSPSVTYALNANKIDANGVTLETVSARGKSVVNSDSIQIPVTATIRKVSGLNATAGGLLTNVRINGDLAVSKGRILSDNLKIRSDRLDATAIIVANTGAGIYTGAINGRVNGYQIDSVGLFNVDTDMKLDRRQNGFALRGTVRGRSIKLFNNGVRDFLGGNALLRTGLSYGSDGVTRVSGVTLASPQFRMTRGQGSYSPSGAIRFAGDGFSGQYGAVGVKVSGTISAPVAAITASRPGLGIGLAEVRATIKRSSGGFGLLASGVTDYGPFTADVEILSAKGPLTLAIKRADFAGIALQGRIQKTSAGPFAGRLSGLGAGFEGTVLLSSFQGKQRAVIDAAARNARFSGNTELSIGRAIIAADIILYAQPQVVADVQLAETRLNSLFIAAGRAKIDYRAGRGSARLLAEGSSGAPFRVTANAALEPALWRVALQGRANSIDFNTATPAHIIPRNGTYELLPATLQLTRGSLQLAGKYGRNLLINSRLKNVDLALLNPIFPGLGLDGNATGSLNFTKNGTQAFPSAEARLNIAGFTRTNLASISQPVDISLVAKLIPQGGSMRAVIRRRGAIIGQMQANLLPLPPGAGNWNTRLFAAPLSGGIRYNGPADTLFSLAALPDQSLNGAIGVAADFSGRVQSPQLSGVVRANNLVYENSVYGTKLTKLRVRGTFTNDQLEVTELTAKAGKGTISGKGFVSLSSARGFPVQLNLDLQNARVANSNYIAAEASGSINIINSDTGAATISGTLKLPETRYKIVRQSAAAVPTLTGVRRKPALGRAKITGDASPIKALPSNWNLDIKLIANDKVFVSGMGLESEWAADLAITGSSSAPKINGQIKVLRGTLAFAGRSFEITEGRINFTGGAISNPNIRLAASSNIEGVTTRITVRGSGDNPEIAFSSVPNLPQEELMARILFGNSVGQLSAVQALQLAGSLNSLSSGGKGLNPLGVLQSAAGIDRLRILGADNDNGRGTAVALGQYISNDVYVEIITDARGYTATQLEISLTPALSLLGEVSSFGGSNINVRYRKDY